MVNYGEHPIVTIALLAVVAGLAYSYRWTYTRFGRLNYRAAVSLRLLTFPYTHKPDSKSDFKVRLPINLIYLLSAALPKEKVANVKDIVIAGAGVNIPARVYWPGMVDSTKALPVIVYFHGGGFVVGSVNIFDPLTRSLANATRAIVVSVDYRLAPVHPHPAAIDDAYAALQWAARNAASLGGDPLRIIVAGDSAGGNLAAVMSIKARDESGPSIAAQILYYPDVDLTDAHYESKDHFSDGYGMSREQISAFNHAYVGLVKDKTNPYISPLYSKSLKNLPPALIVTAGFDRLTDSIDAYIRKLEQNGVSVRACHFHDIIHGFMSVQLFPQRRDALDNTHQFLNDLWKSRAS